MRFLAPPNCEHGAFLDIGSIWRAPDGEGEVRFLLKALAP